MLASKRHLSLVSDNSRKLYFTTFFTDTQFEESWVEFDSDREFSNTKLKRQACRDFCLPPILHQLEQQKDGKYLSPYIDTLFASGCYRVSARVEGDLDRISGVLKDRSHILLLDSKLYGVIDEKEGESQVVMFAESEGQAHELAAMCRRAFRRQELGKVEVYRGCVNVLAPVMWVDHVIDPATVVSMPQMIPEALERARSEYNTPRIC